MGKIIDLLYDFHQEMKDAEEEWEGFSPRETIKAQLAIALEYEEKIKTLEQSLSNKGSE